MGTSFSLTLSMGMLLSMLALVSVPHFIALVLWFRSKPACILAKGIPSRRGMPSVDSVYFDGRALQQILDGASWWW
jgi:hypothetical protein